MGELLSKKLVRGMKSNISSIFKNKTHKVYRKQNRGNIYLFLMGVPLFFIFSVAKGDKIKKRTKKKRTKKNPHLLPVGRIKISRNGGKIHGVFFFFFLGSLSLL